MKSSPADGSVRSLDPKLAGTVYWALVRLPAAKRLQIGDPKAPLLEKGCDFAVLIVTD